MPRVNLLQTLLYGLPGLPLAAASIPLVIYLPTYYARELAIDLTLLGQLLLLARLWDVVSDPVIGILTDHTRSRFGRRRPWLVAGTPVVLLGLWHLFVPPAGTGPGGLFLWAIVLYTGWTMVTLPHQSWGAELSADYNTRTRIAGFREGAQIAGIVLACALPLVTHQGIESLSGSALRGLAWFVMIALPVTVVLAALFIPDPPEAKVRHVAWREGWHALRDNVPFRRLLLAYLINGVANGLPATLFLLFVGEVLQLADRTPVLLLIYFLSGVVAVPAWVALSARIGKHRAWSGSMLWNSLVFLAVPFLGPGDFWPYLVVCVLSGLSLGADLALPAAMQADVVDVDRAATGAQRTGLYFALWAMATKLALALAVGIAFPALAALGFVAESGANAPQALFALSAFYGLVPVAFKLVATALIWNFPLDARAQADLRREVAPT